MSYTTTDNPGKIVSLLACFDDGMIVIYDVCQHHMSEVSKAEAKKYKDQRSKALTVQGALFPELRHWLFFAPQQAAQMCSVCLQQDHDGYEPQDPVTPISRVAAPLKDD